MTEHAQSSKRRIARYVPILDWAPHYDRAWLRADIIAGLTVSALVVPKSLGYAGIANVPIENGLYAAAAGAILYALFGTSRQIATNPSSGLSAVAGSAVILSGVSNDHDAAALVSAIALLTGALFLIMTIFRMGWISQFISRAVIVGFLFGAAIEVTIGELPKLTGTKASGDNAWQEFWSWLKGLGDLHRTTLLVGVLSLVALFGLRAFVPQLPGTLVVVVGGLIASGIFNLGDHGVALVGHVPRGLPAPAIPDLHLVWDHIYEIGVAAAAIVMIGFSQSAGDARAFATKHRYRVDIDQESLAQGVANAGSGLFQGIPVSTSLSASSLNDTSGAKTQLASLTTGIVVILTLLAFAPLFSGLPKPVLGAVIIDAVIMGMIDIPALRRLLRVKRTDFWIAIAAIVGVLLAGVLAGVVIGVFLSVGWLVQTVTSPPLPVLGRVRGTTFFRNVENYPDTEQFPGIVVLEVGNGLYFATADSLGDRVRELSAAAESPLTAIVLNCRSLDFVDAQGSAQLGEIIEEAHRDGFALRLARVNPQVLEILTRDGIIDRLGTTNLHADVNDAVEVQLGLARTSMP